MRTPFFIVIMLFAGVLAAQTPDFKRDYVWPLAYNPGGGVIDSPYLRLDFANDLLNVEQFSIGIPVYNTNATICNQLGELLFYSNGMSIAGLDQNIIVNGDSLCLEAINYSGTFTPDMAVTLTQGAILLPAPDDTKKYYLFHEELSLTTTSINNYSVLNLYQTTVEFNIGGNFWEVTEKSETIKSDTLEWGKITACRHANGRDWWLLAPRHDSGIYYRFLIDSNGVNELPPINVNYVPGGAGQSCFTPDGSKYVRVSYFSTNNGSKIRVYDFDRREGVFTDEKNINLNSNYNPWGAAISPNSKYLYVMASDSILQYDLTASNIQSTKQVVAVYDGFVAPWFATRFVLGQLAPDGRIYISTGNTTDRLHVINKPDKQGEACEVLQHSVLLPSYNNSIPNFPNFRLGPIDGSSCDTLGLDNLPVAGWRHDTLPPLTVEFTDNSYYNVTDWIWKFGDGGTDTVEHPVHSYTAPGLYWVCQIVSNENAADTLCKWVQVGEVQDTIPTEPPTGWATDTAVALQPDRETITPTTQADHSQGIRVYPNPARDYVFVQPSQPLRGQFTIRVTDMMGRELLHQPLAAMVSTLDVREWASGVYFYEILAPSLLHEGGSKSVLQSGKVVKY